MLAIASPFNMTWYYMPWDEAIRTAECARPNTVQFLLKYNFRYSHIQNLGIIVIIIIIILEKN